MFSINKQPASTLIAQKVYKSGRQSCSKYGFDFNKLLKAATKPDANIEEYESLMRIELDTNFDRVNKELRKQGAITLEQVELNVNNIGNLLGAMYTFHNSRRFIYDTKCNHYLEFLNTDLPEAIDKFDFMDCFDDIEDIILDFGCVNGYFNLMARLCKTTYTVNSKRCSEAPAFNLTFLSLVGDRSVVIGQLSIVKNIFPNLLLDKDGTVMPCVTEGKCPRCVVFETELIEPDNYTVSKNYCYMTPKKISEHACTIDILQPYKVLKLMAYVWDMYKNRHTLERKNSKRQNSYKIHEVSTISREDNIIRPLHKYYKYEREHKPWQGGHHQSPVEHERRPHERRYFDENGNLKKVVKVKGSVVNKGGKKAIYKVERPDDKMDLF